MNEIMIGTSAFAGADDALLHEAGIGWIRQNFSYPFVSELGGQVTDEYRMAKATAQSWRARGFRVMGVTPLIGIGKQEPDAEGRLRTVWHDGVPSYMGCSGTEQFLRSYQALCAFLAEDLRGTVESWQIANELDIPIFAGPLNPRQACDLILAGARGLKETDPSLIVGTNTAGSAKAYYLYGRLHADAQTPLDYCGVDAYYGTWEEGSPERWAERISELAALTGAKVLVNEWGYASAGGLLTEEERRGSPYVCQHKKWYHAWGAGHTPEVQAEFVRLAYEGFLANRAVLLGAFFYRWEDQMACWQCGAPDCPAETAWGLASIAQQPKPAFYAFRDGVRSLEA